MAIVFQVTPDGMLVRQTRRWLRRWIWVVVGLGLLGLTTTVLVARIPRQTQVTCDRRAGRCTVTELPGHRSHTIPLASVLGARAGDEHSTGGDHRVFSELELRETGTYRLCTAQADETAAAGVRASADRLARFLAAPGTPAVTVSCDSHRAGPGAVAVRLAAGGFGLLIVLWLMARFLVETETRVDRARGTIAMRGRAWPRRRWDFERPLGDVSDLALESRYAGYGQSVYFPVVWFRDGESAIVMAPARYRRAALRAQIAQLCEVLGVGRPDGLDRI